MQIVNQIQRLYNPLFIHRMPGSRLWLRRLRTHHAQIVAVLRDQQSIIARKCAKETMYASARADGNNVTCLLYTSPSPRDV